jgi:threonine 3-dehydrogenase
VLSTRAEYSPQAAHRINVEGTLALLRLATEQGGWLGRPVTFMFPSSIAAYGLPDLQTKARAGAVKEHEWNVPITMYGCNKLYGEHLGRYYARHYRQLAASTDQTHVDFRSIRFPGLISAFTLPTGGTSDYAPDMLHHAAQGKPYACFVREDTRLPFMVMPDAIDALTRLETAPRERLTAHTYNVTSFSPTAGELSARTREAFPGARITFEPDPQRQAIVDSWPADQDDARARRDWDWKPAYDQDRAFHEYLVPNIRGRYSG